jgi:hypothetical protein
LLKKKKNLNKYNKNIEYKIKTKKLEEENMGKLKCGKCGKEMPLPIHCGKAMHKEGKNLVCWMGASCGSQPISQHCGKPMNVVD